VNLDKAQVDFFAEIQEKKIISGDLFLKGISLFGEKFEKALYLVKNLKIVKMIGNPSNRIVWKCIGDENEYVLFPLKYCQCVNFNISMTDKKISLCKHLIAQKIAETLNQIHFEEIADDEIPKMIKETLKQNKE
jgi:predicted nucleic acid-binding Zn finger protein